jgi:two-component system, sensor histidine kinase
MAPSTASVGTSGFVAVAGEPRRDVPDAAAPCATAPASDQRAGRRAAERASMPVLLGCGLVLMRASPRAILGGEPLAEAGLCLAAGMVLAWAIVLLRRRQLRDRARIRGAIPRRAWRPTHGAFARLGFATVASLAAVISLSTVSSGSEPGVSMAVGGLAIAGAALLAPLCPLALAFAALPAATALLGALVPGHASASFGAEQLDSVAVTAIAIGVAWSRHQAWMRLHRGLQQRDRCIEDLQSQRDLAQRADDDKSRFLGVASHDLRQPVHALGLFAATLERRMHGLPDEPLARNIMRAVDSLDRSFNVMLDVSRLDIGSIEPNMQCFPLRDLFRRLHMQFAGQAELSGLGLRFSPGGKSVCCDPHLLERVIGNLVQNALKYTETGGVVVVARSTSTHVNVEIWDTGRGMEAAELPKIFGEFYQVDQARGRRVQGLGMGLAIVRRLAELLELRLVVASRPGRGTMFRVGIPLGALAEVQDMTTAAETVPAHSRQARTVLVIDDEAPIRDGLVLLLQEWGYCAVACESALQVEGAMTALPDRLDLVISDLDLGPGADGVEAIAIARRIAGYPVPAIVVTGNTGREQLPRLTESGHPVLLKPVLPRKLHAAVAAQMR